MQVTSEEMRAYIDQWADTILVRVKLGCSNWLDISIKDLRLKDASEAKRVEERLIERGTLPHRILIF